MLPGLKSSLAPDHVGRHGGATVTESGSTDRPALAGALALATRIRLALRAEERSVGVCGLPGDALSDALAAELAMASVDTAQGDVLLVDADVAAPTRGSDNVPGLCEWLAGECALNAALRRADAADRLALLPLGERAALVRLLTSGRGKEAFDELRARFERIVVAIGAGASSAEGLLLAEMCDAIVVAVPVGSTREDVAAIRRHLGASRARLLGAVLVRSPKGRAHG